MRFGASYDGVNSAAIFGIDYFIQVKEVFTIACFDKALCVIYIGGESPWIISVVRQYILHQQF